MMVEVTEAVLTQRQIGHGIAVTDGDVFYLADWSPVKFAPIKDPESGNDVAYGVFVPGLGEIKITPASFAALSANWTINIPS